eukprot:CAMPEP_0184873886 /NCGR_PEP_ID=MMETSP0580-20130426/42085_1 /TAXON_ID=1118495 /ORGANISM="Dactyliosolen fragilissimus" /LENGTH=764 /DNA_ID=CAMNT_0027376829 /DNA_START=264 /DNA_END=2558 /DNA_ORIENTATION=-
MVADNGLNEENCESTVEVKDEKNTVNDDQGVVQENKCNNTNESTTDSQENDSGAIKSIDKSSIPNEDASDNSDTSQHENDSEGEKESPDSSIQEGDKNSDLEQNDSNNSHTVEFQNNLDESISNDDDRPNKAKIDEEEEKVNSKHLSASTTVVDLSTKPINSPGGDKVDNSLDMEQNAILDSKHESATESNLIPLDETSSLPSNTNDIMDKDTPIDSPDKIDKNSIKSSSSSKKNRRKEDESINVTTNENKTSKPHASGGTSSDEESQMLLVELQSSLQSQMTLRAEAEDKLRRMEDTLLRQNQQLEKYSSLEDELESLKANMVQVVSDKSNLENEVSRLRDVREDFERKEAVLNNRLNEAKKKEATKTNQASRLETSNSDLKVQLSSTQKELKEVTLARDKLQHGMDKLKKKCVDKVKTCENALAEERSLNEERKSKMKSFVEKKAEELRSAKEETERLVAELDQTSSALTSLRNKLEDSENAHIVAQERNRDLLREINRMKKDSEHLHRVGDDLESELQKTSKENVEHRNKRLTARHELMTVLRKLEAEQAASGRLRDGVKFTFTPKAISQQQLLCEGLEAFEKELLRLSRKLGKPISPSIFSQHGSSEGGNDNDNSITSSSNENRSQNNSKSRTNMAKTGAKSRAEWDTSRLLSNLENETQNVSKKIMELSSTVERMKKLLDDDAAERSCSSVLNDFLKAAANSRASTEGNGSRGGISNLNNIEGTHSSHDDFADGDEFVGTTKRRGEKYGLVPGSSEATI